MKRYLSRYRVSTPNEHHIASLAVCDRDAITILGDRVGMRIIVAHYGPPEEYSVTTYQRVKAGWRVVRGKRLGGLRWQRRTK